MAVLNRTDPSMQGREGKRERDIDTKKQNEGKWETGRKGKPSAEEKIDVQLP